MFVTLGLGSNQDPVNNLSSCLDALLLKFQDLKLSSVFESEAVGQPDSAPYLNMAVGFETDLSLPELSDWLKTLERKHGRQADSPVVTLDVDILSFGNKQGEFAGARLPRPQILTEAYVLWPLSQVAAKQRHPQTGESYTVMWKNFDGNRSGIRPVAFEWHGRQLSKP